MKSEMKNLKPTLLNNLKSFKVKLKCDKCKGYLYVNAIDLENKLKCRCGGSLSPIESIRIWKYMGYDCEIKRNNYLGTYMGYVILGKESKFYEKSIEELETIEIHGGITYAAYQEGKEGERYWKIGFDTAHGFDYIPIWRGTALDKLKEQIGMFVWTEEGVKKEVEKLVDQLIWYERN